MAGPQRLRILTVVVRSANELLTDVHFRSNLRISYATDKWIHSLSESLVTHYLNDSIQAGRPERNIAPDVNIALAAGQSICES